MNLLEQQSYKVRVSHKPRGNISDDRKATYGMTERYQNFDWLHWCGFVKACNAILLSALLGSEAARDKNIGMNDYLKRIETSITYKGYVALAQVCFYTFCCKHAIYKVLMLLNASFFLC